MPLTHRLDIPNAPVEGKKWSITRIFGGSADSVGVVIKNHRPMEFAFLFMVLATFILMLFSCAIAIGWWIVIGFTFVGAIVQHEDVPILEGKEVKDKTKEDEPH